jgi:hypothetical protein
VLLYIEFFVLTDLHVNSFYIACYKMGIASHGDILYLVDIPVRETLLKSQTSFSSPLYLD